MLAGLAPPVLQAATAAAAPAGPNVQHPRPPAAPALASSRRSAQPEGAAVAAVAAAASAARPLGRCRMPHRPSPTPHPHLPAPCAAAAACRPPQCRPARRRASACLPRQGAPAPPGSSHPHPAVAQRTQAGLCVRSAQLQATAGCHQCTPANHKPETSPHACSTHLGLLILESAPPLLLRLLLHPWSRRRSVLLAPCPRLPAILIPAAVPAGSRLQRLLSILCLDGPAGLIVLRGIRKERGEEGWRVCGVRGAEMKERCELPRRQAASPHLLNHQAAVLGAVRACKHALQALLLAAHLAGPSADRGWVGQGGRGAAPLGRRPPRELGNA